MAVKKISELTTKSFLGTDGAAENSYVLINYAETANGTPITYKATIEELGKAIAANLNLADKYGKSIAPSDNNTYGTGLPGNLVTFANASVIGVPQGTLLQSGLIVPNILTYNADDNEYGYFADAYRNTWTTVSLGDGGNNNGGGNASAAPSGAMYIFESQGEYILGSTASDTSQPLIGTIAADTGYENSSGENFSYVVATSETLYYVNAGSTTAFTIDEKSLPQGFVTADLTQDHCLSYKDSTGTVIDTLTTPYASTYSIVTVDGQGNLFYYDDTSANYKLISTLQN